MATPTFAATASPGPQARAKRPWTKRTVTDAVIEQYCEFIAGGLGRASAAVMCGIPRSTMESWLTQGQKARSGQLRRFAAAVELAEAKCELKHLQHARGKRVEEKVIQQGLDARGRKQQVERKTTADPRESQWFLARKWPERYGRKMTEVEHSGKVDTGGGKHEVVVTLVEPEAVPEDEGE